MSPRVGGASRFSSGAAWARRLLTRWRILASASSSRAMSPATYAAVMWSTNTPTALMVAILLGHGTIAVTERYGTIGDDLVEREALRLVQRRAQGGARRYTGPKTRPSSLRLAQGW